MVESSAVSHIKEVEHFAAGGHSNRDPLVLDSWKRCVESHGLDPARMQDAYIVPHSELREHQERMEELIRTARFGLESLHQQVAGLGYVLLLSDADGITVDFIGDPTFDNQLRTAGLYLGANWKEEFAGTCAVGSCLATQESLIVHQTDHFDSTHTSLTCTAAPIHDINGQIAAVLDISALRSPQMKNSQYLALELVNSYIRRIEMANLMRAFRSNWILQFSPSHQFLGVEPSCAVALDAAGRIAGFTNNAQRLLAAQVGSDWRDSAKLIGRAFTDFFHYAINDLPALTRAAPTHERLIELRDGSILFALAEAPQQPLSFSSKTRRLPKPLRDICDGDAETEQMLKKAARLADSPISLLLQGETGTGKEVLARAIHASRRNAKRFIAVNCAALPESLIESELFGYVSGAFTGASPKGRQGLIQKADGGTLFLDEIGDMPLDLQTRFLRVLAEKEVVPVGGDKPIRVNIRVIAATHSDLREAIYKGEFREDLFYRINGAVLTLSPLRKRMDFDWLLKKLLNSITPPHHMPMQITSEAREKLRSYDWPGNIRELLNALEFAVAVCDSGPIGLDDLPEFILHPLQKEQSQQHVQRVEVDEQTRHLLEALKAHRWNISATARFLGVDRTTVHRKMKKLGIVSPNKRPA